MEMDEEKEIENLVQNLHELTVTEKETPTADKKETVSSTLLASHQVYDLWSMKQKIDSWMEKKPKVLNRAATVSKRKY